MYLIFCNFALFHSIILMYLRGASTERADIDREGAGRRYARAKSIDSMIFWKFDLGPYVSFPITFGGLPKIWYVHKIAIWCTSNIWWFHWALDIIWCEKGQWERYDLVANNLLHLWCKTSNELFVKKSQPKQDSSCRFVQNSDQDPGKNETYFSKSTLERSWFTF